jgi:V/A-type H+-transporting ATPase subunit B
MRKIYYRIEEIAGPVIKINADNIAYGELAKIYLSDGTLTYGQVIRLQGSLVSLQVFAGSKGVRTDDKVEFLSKQVTLLFDNEKLLGRIFNGVGEPIDGKASLDNETAIEIGGPSFNPAKRIIPSNMIETGIPMIDMFNSLVESQNCLFLVLPGNPIINYWLG